MLRSLVGSEMCIRDRERAAKRVEKQLVHSQEASARESQEEMRARLEKQKETLLADLMPLIQRDGKPLEMSAGEIDHLRSAVLQLVNSTQSAIGTQASEAAALAAKEFQAKSAQANNSAAVH
eukprot:TRINITY_DN16732_c0_g2_i2.p2 TRINITY_DN16732_c0_g2~~TRINITY_DN16732_c0_g2_i2.p2  ORF type:complete len:122 (-),score=46.78 TRINITY_DN16732_c0_g2_i2:476-841(-)